MAWVGPAETFPSSPGPGGSMRRVMWTIAGAVLACACDPGLADFKDNSELNIVLGGAGVGHLELVGQPRKNGQASSAEEGGTCIRPHENDSTRMSVELNGVALRAASLTSTSEDCRFLWTTSG